MMMCPPGFDVLDRDVSYRRREMHVLAVVGGIVGVFWPAMVTALPRGVSTELPAQG
jgi:hypothetical protein